MFFGASILNKSHYDNGHNWRVI
uniref:Uncharacterized protein n=1 Tax=Anguilla anguilla TaxID=7936 RepID=A0A0E9U0I8_ANGAN